MRILFAIAPVVIAAALATPAAAQQQPVQPSPETLALQASLATEWRPMHSDRLQYEQFLEESQGNNISTSLERVDLANRVSGLIQLGRCREARDLANAEGDRMMALRARQICRPRRG